MEKRPTLVPKLFTAKGSIFDYKGNFDAIVAFIDNGLTAIRADFSIIKSELEAAPDVLAIVITPDQLKLNNEQRFGSKRQLVREMVNQSLAPALKAGCKNIGFHGIRLWWNGGREDCEADAVAAIEEWLRAHGEQIDTLTLVDARDSYSRYIH